MNYFVERMTWGAISTSFALISNINHKINQEIYKEDENTFNQKCLKGYWYYFLIMGGLFYTQGILGYINEYKKLT